MPATQPKIIIENRIYAKASHITNIAALIYGSLWKAKKVNGVIITCEKKVPEGSTRNATFVTAEWSLPGRIVVKELNSRLVQYIPDENGSEIVAIPQPADAIVDAPGAANAIHAAPEPLIVNPELVAEKCNCRKNSHSNSDPTITCTTSSSSSPHGNTSSCTSSHTSSTN